MSFSPKLYGKPAGKMKSQESAMILFNTFVPSSVPLEAEKRNKQLKTGSIEGKRTTPLRSQPLSPLHIMEKVMHFSSKWVTRAKDP